MEAHLRKVEALCALCSCKGKAKEDCKVVGERAFPQQLTRESASSRRRYLRDPEHELVHCCQPVIANKVVPFLQDKERDDGRTDVFHFQSFRWIMDPLQARIWCWRRGWSLCCLWQAPKPIKIELTSRESPQHTTNTKNLLNWGIPVSLRKGQIHDGRGLCAHH